MEPVQIIEVTTSRKLFDLDHHRHIYKTYIIIIISKSSDVNKQKKKVHKI